MSRPVASLWPAVLLVLLGCCFVATHAYPQRWSACTPPAFGQGNHFAVDGSDKPLSDSTIKVALARASRPVATYCPGGTYSIKISWPSTRHAFITTTLGALTPNDGCSGRRYRFPDSLKVASWSATLKFPCTAKGAAVIKVVTAKSSSSPYQQISATFRPGTAAACRSVARCPRGK